MLHLKYLDSSIDSRRYFESVDFNSSTWIVSDLDSKLKLREMLLTSKSVLPDDTVMRAHELWKTILLRLEPKFRFISRDTALAFVSKKLQSFPDNLNKPGVADLVLNYISFLMPILSHDNGNEAINDFFSKDEINKNKWNHWYLLSEHLFKEFKNENSILMDWCSGLLVNQTDLKKSWKKNLFFDLSGNLTSLEAELIIALSKFLEVTVLVPNPAWKRNHKKTLQAYEILDSHFLKTGRAQGDRGIDRFLKLSTQLGEVKAAVTTVRCWLDEGVGLSEIAILAPDIGVYWATLKEFLNIEGVPTQRSVRAPLRTFAGIQSWLSKIKIHMSQRGEVLSSDLESSLFSHENTSPLLPFHEFKQTFSNVYDWNDLKRDEKIYSSFSKVQTIPDAEVTKDVFIQWIVSLWEGQDTLLLQTLLSAFFQEAQDSMLLPPKQWFEILDSLAGRKEAEIEPGCKNGIVCLDIGSAKEIRTRKIFMMGLSETQLRSQYSVHLDESAVFKLKQDYGFVVPYPENTNLEFEANWILENSQSEFTLSYAQADFDGNALAPSIVWLRGAIEKYGKNPSLFTKFEDRKTEIYYNTESLSNVREWSEEHGKNMNQVILRDLGRAELEKISYFPKRVSATSLENYLSCPFIFSAKKIFHLSDLPEIDLDVDFLTRGRLLHEVFNVILETDLIRYSDQQILGLIDQSRQTIGFKVADETLWQSHRLKYLQFTKQFIEFEMSWRRKFPKTVTQFREKDFQGSISIHTGAVETGSGNSSSVEFTGKVDRVDIDSEGHAVLIDYKFSSQAKSNYGSWVTKRELQLALYAMALEKGLLGTPLEVVGAIYYSIKDLNREKGFLLSGETSLFDLNTRKRNHGNQTDKDELFKHIQETTKKILSDMRDGIYFAKPSDTKECDRCKWGELCRAPHLI